MYIKKDQNLQDFPLSNRQILNRQPDAASYDVVHKQSRPNSNGACHLIPIGKLQGGQLIL